MTKATLEQEFQRLYGRDPESVAVAPGRVNLIGEHTDYNDGFVLPCALEFTTQVAYRPRKDRTVRVTSLNYNNEQVCFRLDEPLVPGDCSWANYIIGVYYAFQKTGWKLNGADLMIHGNVPQGAGLSSSAALEVAVACAVNEQNKCRIAPMDIALLGQFAENGFLGCQTGIMDQMISALAKERHALLLDCEDLSGKHIPIPDDLKLLVVNSNYKRTLVGSEYNQRRSECEKAASCLGVSSLRHVTLEQLAAEQLSMDKNAYKRARHVISENRRTLAAAEALTRNDFATLREMMFASHASLRDDFEVTVPATDLLVEIIREEAGESGAARMTGGGFGGAVVAFLRPDVVDRVSHAIQLRYSARFDLAPTIYQCNAGPGMHLL